MPLVGTLVNVVAILVGTALGVALGGRLPDRMRDTVMDGLGLLTLLLGMSLALQTESFFVVMGAVLIGGVTGEMVGIERRLEALGSWFQGRLAGTSDTFSEGFVTASLLFCVGPMAILGSIQDGLLRDPEILVIKSVLDGVAALAFAVTLGWGVGLSALSVGVYEGALTLLAGGVDQVLTDAMVNEMTATGGILILAIALRILDLRRVRVGNLLPALLFAPLFVFLAASF
jgi:uncharacterized membrane protein YqgA involved in biofilm formation